MNRSEIFRLKLKIEADGRIGHGTRALGLRVCSWIYNHPQHRFMPGEPFPLPWTRCSELLWGSSKRQVYYMLGQLVDNGHLAHEGIMGCPGQAHYRLVVPDAKCDRAGVGRGAINCTPRSAKNCTPRSAKCDPTRGAKNHPTRGATKRTPLNNILPTEEIVSPMEVNGGLSPGKKRGGNLMAGSAVATPEHDGAAARSRQIRELREKLKGS